MKRNHLGPLAGAVLCSALVLSGCQQDPDNAAVVGDQVITASDVDLLSDAMCEERRKLADEGQSAAAPRSVARDEALLALIRVELAEEALADASLQVDTASANQFSKQFAEEIDSVQEPERPRLRELIRALLLEQQQMIALAQKSFEAQGQQAPQDPGTLIEVGRQQVLEDEDLPQVDVNPRYASPQFDQFGVARAALSKPVSKTAKAALGEVEGGAVLEDLPENLRCG